MGIDKGVRRTLLALGLALALVGLGCTSSDEDSSDSEPSPEETESPSASEVADRVEQRGPYAVGASTLEVIGPQDRTLPVEVWYPVEADAAASAEAAIYEFPAVEVPSVDAVSGVPVADGEFPLVVYSHGNGGLRYVSAFLTEHLASHGFIVVAPDHVGNTAVDTFAGSSLETDEVAELRPADVAAAIEAVSTGEGEWAEVSESAVVEDLAVIGHSFGGYTALATAAGVSTPEDLGVDAVVGMAAATEGLSEDELESVGVPTMLLSGTADITVPVDPDTERAAEYVTGRPLVRVDMTDVGHQSFSDVCEYQDLVAGMPELADVIVEAIDDYAEEGCAGEYLEIGESHRLIKRFTTAFLLNELAGDSDTAVLLDPQDGATDNVSVFEVVD